MQDKGALGTWKPCCALGSSQDLSSFNTDNNSVFWYSVQALEKVPVAWSSKHQGDKASFAPLVAQMQKPDPGGRLPIPQPCPQQLALKAKTQKRSLSHRLHSPEHDELCLGALWPNL